MHRASLDTVASDMEAFNKRTYSRKSILLAFLISLVCLLFSKAMNRDVFGGSMLDISWVQGLNMASKEELTWGREFVFTYGPLGYLTTGFSQHASRFWILVFHLYIFANASYFIYHVVGRAGEGRRLLSVMVLLVLNSTFLFDADTVSLFFFFVFHGWIFMRSRSLLSQSLLSATALLSFFIKVNTGIVVNFLFVALCLVNRRSGVIGFFRALSFLVVHFCALLIMSIILKVDLGGYVVNGLSIVDAYNDAMYLPADPFWLMCALTALILLFLPYLMSLRRVLSSFNESFMFFVLILFAFILFKQSFVRADTSHVYYFLTGIPFVALLALFSTSVSEIRSNLHVSVIAISMVSILSMSSDWRERVGRLKGAFSNPGFFLNRWGGEDDARIRDDSLFPAEVIARIGDRGIDVLGYQISHVYYNGLKYDPRPVFQSYTAYSSRLIGLNYDKYAGEKAPDFVLYHFGTIDDRHPFWDEPRTYLPLMAGYRVADSIHPKGSSTDFLLFERLPVRKSLQERVLMDTVVGLNFSVHVPRGRNPIYMQMECGLTMAGSLRRLLYQPPGVGMELTYEDGETQRCRLILPIMESGVPINRKVTTEQEAFEFFRSQGKGSESTDSFKILADPFWVRSDVRVRFIECLIGE